MATIVNLLDILCRVHLAHDRLGRGGLQLRAPGALFSPPHPPDRNRLPVGDGAVGVAVIASGAGYSYRNPGQIILIFNF